MLKANVFSEKEKSPTAWLCEEENESRIFQVKLIFLVLNNSALKLEKVKFYILFFFSRDVVNGRAIRLFLPCSRHWDTLWISFFPLNPYFQSAA